MKRDITQSSDEELEKAIGSLPKFLSPLRLQFSRPLLKILISGCFFLPVLITLFYQPLSELVIALILSVFFGIFVSFTLLNKWERKLKSSVTNLVQNKMRQLGFIEGEPGDPKGLFAEVEHLRAQEKKSQAEIGRLKEILIDTRKGYEHQIDLFKTTASKGKEQVEELNFQMDKKNEELRLAYLHAEDLKKELIRFSHEMEEKRSTFEEQLKHKDSLLTEYQHTISEQRLILEKKQRYISKLEGKVRDLMYEIRSLLQLEEPALPYSPETTGEIDDCYLTNDSPVDAVPIPYDLSVDLMRYIQMVQSITGVNHLGYMNGKSPRFLDLSFDSYALDIRRLDDLFRDETTGIIFVFSPLEGKMLFCNNQVKSVLGFSSEKFIKDFSSLVVMGLKEFEEALYDLRPDSKEGRLKLVIRNKEGESQHLDCYLGVVPSGPFASFVIGIFA
ncbi:MAG: hypothetical protein KDK55_02905 [Chlamydiia bacterium]|nr:hypothetical protein [Chlamydiia bacterium]